MPQRRFFTIRDYPHEGIVTLVAFLGAPVLPSLAISAMYPIDAGARGVDWIGILSGAAVFYLYALFFVGLIAVPALLIARWFHMVNLGTAVFAGAATGGVGAALVSSHSDADALRGVISLYAGLGAVAGAIFWALLCTGRRFAIRESDGL